MSVPLLGWVCPRCQTVRSPYDHTCDCRHHGDAAITPKPKPVLPNVTGTLGVTGFAEVDDMNVTGTVFIDGKPVADHVIDVIGRRLRSTLGFA